MKFPEGAEIVSEKYSNGLNEKQTDVFIIRDGNARGKKILDILKRKRVFSFFLILCIYLFFRSGYF